MARKHRNKRNGGKRNIKFIERVHFKEKNDATRVDRQDTTSYPRMQARPPADVGVTFRVKIKRK